MTTTTEHLTSIEGYITDCFDAVSSKGGTLPATKNAMTLITAIDSIYGSSGDFTPATPPVSPTVQDTLDSFEAHLSQAYDVVEAKGGTIPSNKNWANLSPAILTIPPVYGYLTYTTTGNNTAVYEIRSEADMQALNAPVDSINSKDPWTISLQNLTISSTQVKEFEFTALGGALTIDYFLAVCPNLTTVTGTEYLNHPGSYFCSNDTSLNCPITYPGAGDQFLTSCSSLNSPVTIKPGASKIGGNFLGNCTSFNQAVTIPSSVTQISFSFLHSCTSFNQPLTIPNSVTFINSFFLNSCTSFNSPLVLPNKLSKIPTSFLERCVSFNQPLTIPPSVTTIGTAAFSDLRDYTQPLVFPESVTTLNSNFLSGVVNFVGPLWVPADFTYQKSTTGTELALTAGNGQNSAPSYTTGIQITGPGADKLRELLPNGPIYTGGSTPSAYRKLR